MNCLCTFSIKCLSFFKFLVMRAAATMHQCNIPHVVLISSLVSNVLPNKLTAPLALAHAL